LNVENNDFIITLFINPDWLGGSTRDLDRSGFKEKTNEELTRPDHIKNQGQTRKKHRSKTRWLFLNFFCQNKLALIFFFLKENFSQPELILLTSDSGLAPD